MLFEPMRKTMKPQFIFTVVLSLFAIHSFAANGTMKGDGSASKPFQIEDYEDLKAIGKGAYLYSSDYVLTKDIDASASKNEMCNEEGCNGFIPIGKYKDAADSTVFWGNIDGQNHTISDLMIWLPCRGDLGFISYLIGSLRNLNFDRLSVTGGTTDSRHVGGVVAKVAGVLENVHVRNGFVQGEERVGGIAGATMKLIGYSDVSSSVKNISFQGEIKGKTCVGGIVGESDLVITDADANVDIIATNAYVGGLVGYNSGKIMNSRASGSITPAYEEVDDVGGIAGYSGKWGVISQCISEMDLLNVTRSSMICRLDEGVGGIVGTNHGSVSESYAKGTVEGTEDVGGIAGVSYGSIQNTFALGSVKGVESVGGLVGGNAYHAYDDSHGSILNSYAANVVKGELDVGGLVGYNSEKVERSYWNTEISGLDTSAGGTGLTSAKMMKMASFAGWDALGYEEYVVDGTDTCSYYEDVGACYSPTGNFIHTWKIDEGKSFPYLGSFSVLPTSKIPLAAPTSAAKWQEQPKVAAMLDVGEELFGKWLNLTQINETKDSIYHWYRIGYAVGTDTVWGTSSYMAVPNKIEISSYDELKKIGNDLAYPLVAHYELTKDIDASSSKFTPIGDSIHMFTGSFDGKNHTIKNLEIDEPKRDFVGFFGVAEGATIKDLKFVNAKVTGSWNVGVLAGELDLSNVINVVSIDGNVLGFSYVGGLIGATRSANMNKIGSTGFVRGDDRIGGLIGASASVIIDAFSVNVVRGYENVGGVIGLSDQFDSRYLQQNIYSASILKSPYDEYGQKVAKGIIGGNFFGSGEDMKSCYYDSTVAALGRIDGYSTELMLKQSTYEGFNFDSVWTIQEGKSYPYFKGMEPILPGTLKDDGSVNVLAGRGTADSPYKISKYSELKYVGRYEYAASGLYFMLTQNINAYASIYDNCNDDRSVCKGFEPIPAFDGTFIGNNKIIGNLNINRPDEDSVGLFRSLEFSARITGLVIDTSSNFTGKDNWDYQRKTFKPTVRGKKYVGGLAGVDNGALLDSVFVRADVSGVTYVGGLVGEKSGGSITRSASKGSVAGENAVGGLVGSLNKAGDANGIVDCYSVSATTGTDYVGGLVGYLNVSKVKNSFAAGYVYGTSKWGGLVGYVNNSTVTSSYYDGSLWGVKTTAAGEIRSTQQMFQQETYKNWDFAETWKPATDSTYPCLNWHKDVIQPASESDTSMLHMAGSGTEADPFLIKTYGDLKSIGKGRYKLSAVYRLVNDIDASASKNENVGHYFVEGFEPIGNDYLDKKSKLFGPFGDRDMSRDFTGKFYGGGHAIKNLYMKSDNGGATIEDRAFFAKIAEKGYVDSLSLVNLYSEYMAAAFAVDNWGTIDHVSIEGKLENTPSGMVVTNRGSITNSSVKASISGNRVGGMVVYNEGTVSKSSVNVSINSSSGAGGIVLSNDSAGVISECSAKVDIVDNYQAGGIAYSSGGIIENSTVSGKIVGVPDQNYNIGGAVGEAYKGRIDHVYSSVDVTGSSIVGGFIGINSNLSVISNSVATGNVSVPKMSEGYSGGFYGPIVGSVGGFAGSNSGTIRRSYSTGDVYNGSSFVGRNYWIVEDGYSLGNVRFDSQMPQKEFVKLGFAFITSDSAQVRGYAFGKIIREGEKSVCAALARSNEFPDGNFDEFYYLADACSDSAMSGKGLTNVQMTLKKSFKGFDFDSVWNMQEGVSYPLLRNMANAPVAANENISYKDNKSLAKNVRGKLLDDAFVMDASAEKVLKLDSASEALLDSLENANAPSGTFNVLYRVGVLVGNDTLWGKASAMELRVESPTGVRFSEMAVVRNAPLGAVFQGGDIAVRFEVPAAAAVKFSLIDMQGRVVQMFDLGHRAAGAHFETLDAGEIARGRYVGVMQVGGKATEKVMLLKR